MKPALKRIALIVFFLTLVIPSVRATHIIGGEIQAVFLGMNGSNWEYEVKIWIYRDCGSVTNAPFDNPLRLTIFRGDTNFWSTELIPFPGATNLPVVIDNPCLVAPPNICAELAVYTKQVLLPATADGYRLSYQRCCRNGGIVNINNPGQTGSTYTITIPGTLDIDTMPNTTPKFNNYPPMVLCLNDPVTIDHSATDIDGDSLVYSFCAPFEGASMGSPSPSQANPPPYSGVTWMPGFNGGFQIFASPSFAINSVTGEITGNPTAVGKYVVGICVQEYRKGILLSENKRDFQFNVAFCDPLSTAAVSTQERFCDGLTVQFKNASTNGLGYFWDFGDPTTTADTSRLFEPIYVYPDTGTYTITLIVNPGYTCADTVYIDYDVYKTLEPYFTPPAGQCFDEHSLDFEAEGLFQQYANFEWDFGPYGVTSASFAKNPSNVKFKEPGVHAVTLTVRENNCEESFLDSIYLYPNPIPRFDVDERGGCVPMVIQFNDMSSAWSDIAYIWNFGDGTTSTEKNPKHVYPIPGNYDITLRVATADVCTTTTTLSRKDFIRVSEIPTAALFANRLTASILDPTITFRDISKGTNLCKLDLGDGFKSVSCDIQHYYNEPGRYRVTQVVESGYGCADTNWIEVFIKPEIVLFVPNTFTPNKDRKNEVFRAYGEKVLDYDFRIYDRWGELIYFTETLENGWDGTRHGEPAPSDVYVYVIRLTDAIEEQHELRGTVTLLR